MKILFTTDLHGHERKYRTLLEFAKKFQVKAVINGGDMLPAYYKVNQGEFIIEVLRPFFSRLADLGIAHFGMLGNDDLNTFDKLFDQVCNEFSNIFNIAQRKILWKPFEVIGMNFVKDYPFQFKDKCRLDRPGDDPTEQLQKGEAFFSDEHGEINKMPLEEYIDLLPTLPTLEDILTSLPVPTDWNRTVLVAHTPPYGLGLDVTPENRQVGSKAVLDYIEKNKPLLSLHGHIHSSPYMTGITVADLEETKCVQPGQPYDKCRVALIDLENLNIEFWED